MKDLEALEAKIEKIKKSDDWEKSLHMECIDADSLPDGSTFAILKSPNVKVRIPLKNVDYDIETVNGELDGLITYSPPNKDDFNSLSKTERRYGSEASVQYTTPLPQEIAPIKHVIEKNKTYRVQDGSSYSMMQVLDVQGENVKIKDLKSGKVKNIKKSSLLSGLDSGHIRVSAANSNFEPKTLNKGDTIRVWDYHSRKLVPAKVEKAPKLDKKGEFGEPNTWWVEITFVKRPGWDPEKHEKETGISPEWIAFWDEKNERWESAES